MSQNLIEAIKSGYALRGEQAKIGVAMLEGKVVPGSTGKQKFAGSRFCRGSRRSPVCETREATQRSKLLPVVKQEGRTAASVITRTLLGTPGLGGTRRRRKSSLW
jgi:hypothetical protein